MNIRWALRARRDVIGIWRRIGADNPRSADGVIDSIDAVIDTILAAPRVGTPLANGDRKMSVRRFPYLVRYRVGRNEVYIKRVHHMAQNWDQ